MMYMSFRYLKENKETYSEKLFEFPNGPPLSVMYFKELWVGKVLTWVFKTVILYSFLRKNDLYICY